ncbi:hypothetical protein CH75_09540 [Dyella jiangningensis]|nr:hypothetical protein CH75_09540 [Dyella jiangningensis]
MGAAAATAMAYGALLPALPWLIGRAGVPPTRVDAWTGWLMAAYSLAAVLTSPLWGWACGRIRPLFVMSWGLVGQMVALTVFWTATTLPSLWMGRMLLGGAGAAVVPAALSILAVAEVTEADRSTLFAHISRAALAGALLGPALGGWLTRGAQIRPALVAAFTILLVSLAWLLRSRAIPIAPSLAAKMFSPTLDRRHRMALLALSTLAALAMSVYELGLVTRGRTVLGLSPQGIGAMFTSCGVIMLLVQLWVFRRGRDPLMIFRWVSPSFVLTGIGLLALSVLQSERSLGVGVLLVASSAGVLQPSLTYWTSRGAGRAAGTALGWRAALTTTGQVIGSVIGGYAFAGTWLGWSALFLIVGALITAAFIANHLSGPCLAALSSRDR